MTKRLSELAKRDRVELWAIKDAQVRRCGCKHPRTVHERTVLTGSFSMPYDNGFVAVFVDGVYGGDDRLVPDYYTVNAADFTWYTMVKVEVDAKPAEVLDADQG